MASTAPKGGTNTSASLMQHEARWAGRALAKRMAAAGTPATNEQRQSPQQARGTVLNLVVQLTNTCHAPSPSPSLATASPPFQPPGCLPT